MIIAGFGFRASASSASLVSAYEQATSGQAISGLAIAGLATAEDKAQAACLTSVATSLDLPIHAISPAAIAAARPITQSRRVLQERATGSLAEAAALAAAGAGARLISPRHISQDGKATCALAIGDDI